jgi:methionyl-tRNA formyltransferase
MKSKNPIRFVFMGTPEFAVPSLKSMLDAGHQCAAVVTVPDKAAGRGLKTQFSAVKSFAIEQGIEVLQPEKLKDPEFLEHLSSLKADLFIVVAFRMLPKEVWSMPPLGCFNLHSSLLPEYRGAAPIQWAIWNGEKESGVTTFLLDEEIDTGKILKQKRIDIPITFTAGDLHDALMKMGAALVVETAEDLRLGTLVAKEQDFKGNLKHAPKIFKEDTHIAISQTAEQILNQIRALSPYPGAVLRLKVGNVITDLKIFSAEIIEDNPEITQSVEVNSKAFLLFGSEGCLQLNELQPAGRKRMKIKDFLNGIGKDWKGTVRVEPFV